MVSNPGQSNKEQNKQKIKMAAIKNKVIDITQLKLT